MDSEIFRIFNEFEKINEEHTNLIQKIHSLCENGHYDQAQKIIDDEYESTHQKWLESRNHWFKALRKINFLHDK